MEAETLHGLVLINIVILPSILDEDFGLIKVNGVCINNLAVDHDVYLVLGGNGEHVRQDEVEGGRLDIG